MVIVITYMFVVRQLIDVWLKGFLETHCKATVLKVYNNILSGTYALWDF